MFRFSFLTRSVCTALVCVSLVSAASAVSIETVSVGNPGNAADTTGYGAVDYAYHIGKYEVTAGQYTEFLNAVAATDTHGLYVDLMWSWSTGCKIQQNGSSGNYTYSVAANMANRPVNFVEWGSIVRFANWLHNGQPTGAQDMSTTEDGAYYLNGGTSSSREPDAKWVIANEAEWYKAAYHKNDGVTGNYWEYPTGSDSVPGTDMTEVTNPGNNANWWGFSGEGVGRTTEVGEYQLSYSPYGTFDQGGNVWELLGSDTWDTVGSAWDDFDIYMSSDWYPDGSGMWESTGFRVVQIPEPTTLGLLTLGGLAMLKRRKKRAF